VPLRIAVAGAGAMGRRHIDVIARCSDCRLVGLVDPAPAAAEVARAARVPLFDSLDGLFAHEKPDGVIIVTPNRMHAEHALACVAAGIPALIEKPVADSVEAARRVCEAGESANVPLLAGHHRQHNPLMAKAVEIVKGGTLGRVVAVTGTAVFYKPDSYFAEGPWRREPGGGPVLINLIHEIGNLRALCGEIVAVQAMTSSATRGFPVEDTAAITLEFAQGALGTFLLSDTAAAVQSWEQTTGENPDYARDASEDCYLVVGTRGSLAFPTLRVRRFDGEPSWRTPMRGETVAAPHVDPLDAQLRNFCDVIRGRARPVVTARDGLENLKVIDAIVRTARERRRVAV
jgi:predicted dehydrogenase